MARTIEYRKSEVDDAFIKFFKKRKLKKAREKVKESLKELEQSTNRVADAVNRKQPKFKKAKDLISKFRDEYLE